jgi:hypothetical protein
VAADLATEFASLRSSLDLVLKTLARASVAPDAAEAVEEDALMLCKRASATEVLITGMSEENRRYFVPMTHTIRELVEASLDADRVSGRRALESDYADNLERMQFLVGWIEHSAQLLVD